MDTIREKLKQPIIIGLIGFLLGLCIGWFIIGWGIWPVQWTDAAPEHLRQDFQEDYLRMAIFSYAQDKDANQAAERFDALGEVGNELLQKFEGDPQTQPFAVEFRMAVQAPPIATPVVMTTSDEQEPTSSNLIRNLFFVMCGATLLVVAGLLTLFFLRKRSVGEKVKPPEMEESLAHDVAWPEYQPEVEDAPMAQYMASYKLGDDLFDDSFSIDSPAGEFLGECGVGISETIGIGDPKKVTAFEVWLFDKNDIQTVTKVLMSEHAFKDEAIHQRLATKGEPILAVPGAELALETQSLQMAARVIDLGYGDGALPPQSYFSRFVLELAVWQKAE